MKLNNFDKYKHIIIDEGDNKFIIKIIDTNNKTLVIECLKNDTGINNMCELIQMYINTFLVNGMSGSIPAIHCVNKNMEDYAEVFCANSNKRISMKIYDPKYKFISKMILDNYSMERDNFFRNSEFNEMMIEANSNVSKYEINGNVVSLTLSTDLNMNVRNSELEFFRKFIEHKCGSRKITVNFIENKNKMRKMSNVSCGEFKMTFPTGFTYSGILGVVYEHNLKIDEMRKRR